MSVIYFLIYRFLWVNKVYKMSD